MGVNNKLLLTFLLSLFFSEVSLHSVVIGLWSSEQLIEHLALADAEHDTVKGKVFKELLHGANEVQNPEISYLCEIL